MLMRSWLPGLLLGLLLFGLTACNLSSSVPSPTASPTEFIKLATDTPQPTLTSTSTPTATATSTSIPPPSTTPVYRVAQGGIPPVCAVSPTVAGANIRSGPGTNFPVIGVLPAANWVRAVRQDASGWYQINLSFTPVDGGWISSTVTTLQPPCVCGPNNCVAVNTPPPTFTSIAPTPTWTPLPNTCALSVIAPTDLVPMYYQPTSNSSVFGQLGYGQFVYLVGRTADGWYGFEVAALQAPNVGIYRLRWIRSDARITLTGAPCGTLKIIDLTAPLPYQDCTVSPVNVSSVSVYSQHTFDAGVWGPLNAGSSLPVVGKTPPNTNGAPNGWYAVQVNPGITPEVGKYALRWLPIDNTVQTSGTCDGMPIVTLDP